MWAKIERLHPQHDIDSRDKTCQCLPRLGLECGLQTIGLRTDAVNQRDPGAISQRVDVVTNIGKGRRIDNLVLAVFAFDRQQSLSHVDRAVGPMGDPGD